MFFHEKITGRKTGCVILALTGCVLVSGVFEKGGLAWSVRGIVCGLLACFFYASYSLVSKRMTQKNYHFLTITFYGTLFSGLSMLPFSNMHTIRALCTPAYFSYTGVMFVPVSYTHLDVYKRQMIYQAYKTAVTRKGVIMTETHTPLSNAETAAFCSQIAMILRSGISSIEGISIMLEDTTEPEEKRLLESINTMLLNTGRCV